MTKRTITSTDKINILELYKITTPKEIFLSTGIPKSTISHFLRLFRVNQNTKHEIIDRIIHQIMIDEESEGINYDRQLSCLHPHLFVKCPHCKLVLSEKDRDKIQAILDKYEPQIEKIRTEQII